MPVACSANGLPATGETRYGTLAPGRPNEHVLVEVPGHWEPATVKGTLLQEGWGAADGSVVAAYIYALRGNEHGN